MHNPRRALIAKTEIGKNQLGLDEATFRAKLKRITGKTSRKDMAVWELENVVEEMKRDGVKFTKKRKTPRPSDARQPIMNKIEAILHDLNLSKEYADGIAKKQHGKTLRMLNKTQLHSVLKALIYHQNRSQHVEKKQ